MRIITPRPPAAVSAPAAAQQPPTPTDPAKASQFTAADLMAAIAKLPGDRAASSVRVFSLAPYNVNVERRLPMPQGASLHEAQAEVFYVIDGSATAHGREAGWRMQRTNLSGKGSRGTTQSCQGRLLIVPSGAFGSSTSGP
jgi:hypothetical protein